MLGYATYLWIATRDGEQQRGIGLADKPSDLFDQLSEDGYREIEIQRLETEE